MLLCNNAVLKFPQLIKTVSQTVTLFMYGSFWFTRSGNITIQIYKLHLYILAVWYRAVYNTYIHARTHARMLWTQHYLYIAPYIEWSIACCPLFCCLETPYHSLLFIIIWAYRKADWHLFYFESKRSVSIELWVKSIVYNEYGHYK